MAKVDCSELAKTLTELAMDIAADPDVQNLDDVVFKMQQFLPEIRRESLIEYMAEARGTRTTQATELSKKLRAIKREAVVDPKTRKNIEDLEGFLETGTLPQKAKPRPAAPEAIAKLRATRDKLKRWVKNSDPAMTEELSKRLDEVNAITREELLGDNPDPKLHAEVQSIQDEIDAVRKKMKDVKAEASLQEKVDTLQKHLDEGTLPEKQARKEFEGGEGATQLRNIIAGLKARLAKSPAAVRAKLEAQIAELTERLESGDIMPKPREVAVMETKELERLEFERDMLRRKIRKEIQRAKPKTVFDRVADPFNLARALMTTGEFSAVRRQGGILTLAHPVRAMNAFKKMFESFASERDTMRLDREISQRPNAPLYARAGLEIMAVDGTATLSKAEEELQSHLIGEIPVLRSFERAYLTFLNYLRADNFDAMAATLARNGTPTLDEAKAIARYVNIASARPNLGKTGNALANWLNIPFFAPRYVASRFQFLLGVPLWKGDAATRKLIATEYARYLIGLGVVYGLAMLAGGDVEDDPRSSDFGKIRFGKTRIDPLSGLQQVTVLVARETTGKTKSTRTGRITPIRGDKVPYGRDDAADVLFRFGRTKLSPMFSTGYDYLTGKDIMNKPVTPGKTLQQLTIPITYREIYDVMIEQGAPAGTAMSLIAMFGEGVSTYNE